MFVGASLERCGTICKGRPFFTCVGACVKRMVGKKVTPKCMQCVDDSFSCGSKKCGNACHYVTQPGQMPPGMECYGCLVQKCAKMAMACGFPTRAMPPL